MAWKDGPQFTLLLAIDDATGIVVNALFCELENTHSYFPLLDGLIRQLRHTDRALFRSACRLQVDSTVGSCRCSNPVQSRDGRAWRTADSSLNHLRPRVVWNAPRERSSDRLAYGSCALRARPPSTMRTACWRAFLPRFNGRFKVPARESEVAYRAVTEEMCLERILCFKYRRRVARDNTVRYRWRTLQLLPGTDRPTCAGAAVDVLEGLDDSLAVQHDVHPVTFLQVSKDSIGR